MAPEATGIDIVPFPVGLRPAIRGRGYFLPWLATACWPAAAASGSR